MRCKIMEIEIHSFNTVTICENFLKIRKISEKTTEWKSLLFVF